MSRKGNCWDNAVTETLFGSLKVERLHGELLSNHLVGQGRSARVDLRETSDFNG
jgi:transposase InsO family protein